MPAATRRPSGSECIHGLVDLRNVAGMGAQRGAADQECFTGERGDVSSGSFALGRGRVFFAGVHGRSRPKGFHGPLRAQVLMMFRAVRYFPTILCCWVFVLKRQRPASPSFPPAAFSPSFRLPSSPLPSACPHRHHRHHPRHHRFGTPLTRFVAPQGGPPNAPVAAPACHHRAHFGTPLTRFVAP